MGLDPFVIQAREGDREAWTRANRLAAGLMAIGYPVEVKPLPRSSRERLVIVTPLGGRIADPGEGELRDILDYPHIHAGYIVDAEH
ncbi:hypothetical protein ASQ66_gp33 [Aeropyrum pernix spindle-shaped virus 1]|uniref:Uncharacterized protein n=1 Tax=Aeropyrum pernix (strain ATCC 700893 / DSM 11879 / JCM 9820 / NBRC 100138 / K1) TaxID=272557 RepID=Q05E45_AERPE|nr:hypothetical protein [Aeropyrum pernix]YP_009177763.1 hypothetical protein ASQ66_gp33 [Aeropyrum pernix spindle-shaped virus 1]BAF34756.1 hypothetical protein APE_0867a [Aeropyrum pernix spindle-shaped virus 1] [Aeropyrum pernix K1]CCD22121.1 TPA: hypothetical protein [Aeropyrum pernix spindle-shaped virus 1]